MQDILNEYQGYWIEVIIAVLIILFRSAERSRLIQKIERRIRKEHNLPEPPDQQKRSPRKKQKKTGQ